MGKVLYLFGLSLGIGALAALTCVDAKPQSKQGIGQKAPASLVDVDKFGENIYDLAKDKDWVKVSEKLKALKEASKMLATDLKSGDSELKRLNPTVAVLEKAVAAKDRHAAMREANQVTLIAANLMEPFNPEVPSAVTRLDHYGRELEIWVEAKDMAKLKGAGDALRVIWEKLQSAVKSRGGDAEAKRFSELMAKVAVAKSVEDYGIIFTPILDEVDNIEKIFKAKKTR